MAILGNVPEIQAVKKQLQDLKEKGLVKEWEIPYEQLLTRLSAAVFFLTPSSDASRMEDIWEPLSRNENLHYRQNEEKKLSLMDWRVSFNKE